MLTIMSPLLVPLAASCATGCFLCHWLLLVPLAASCATGCLQPVLLLLLRRNRRTRRRSRRGSRLLTRGTAAVLRVHFIRQHAQRNRQQQEHAEDDARRPGKHVAGFGSEGGIPAPSPKGACQPSSSTLLDQ